ncbi:MAG: hypothetical protein JRF30_03310 [Deltaproteobacteria bacterium]|nr:hypothetical protein [Deltaproteobacteria bacterium]MBW2329965.1 hypothetical protein [Deltaproteobacteria bacterium]
MPGYKKTGKSMLLVAKEEKTVHREIGELEVKLDFSKKELRALKAELNAATSDIEEESARLKSLNVNFAVTEKEVEDIQSELFLLSEKRSEIDDSVYLLQQELESMEAELEELIHKKGNVSGNIAEVELNMQQELNTLGTLEMEMQEILPAVERREAEKARISEEISDKLSRTSLERDKIESELNDLNISFMSRINERDSIKKLCSEREAGIAGLKEEIAFLRQKCSLLEEVKVLQNRRSSLKGDIETLESEAESTGLKMEERQKLLADKEEEFNGLSTANADRKNSIASLEKEIGVYDEVILKAKNAEDNAAESHGLNEEALSGVERLLADNWRLDSQLRLMDEKASRIVKTVDSMK